jgi:hypothetical protein
VLAIQERLIGPETWRAGVHVVPPSVEEVKPIVSWQVPELQIDCG